jgi:signal transduction histidine kinase
MSIITRYPIRFTVPFCLIAIALCIGCFTWFHDLAAVSRQVELEGNVYVRSLMSRLQRIIENDIRHDAMQSVQDELSYLGVDPNIVVAFLTDPGGIVISSRHLDLVDKPMDGIINAPYMADVEWRELKQKVIMTGSGQLAPAPDSIFAIFPIRFIRDTDSLRPSSQGFLFLRYSFLRLKAEKRQETLQDIMFFVSMILLSSFLIWIFLYFVVNKRIAKLVEVSDRFSAGDRAARVHFDGYDELSVLGKSVDQMIEARIEAEEDIAWNLAIKDALSSLYRPLVTMGTSIEQIADMVLEKSRQLTDSTHGYVGEIDPATAELIAHTNTKMLHTECTIVEKELRKIRFPRRADGLYNGLWGHALNTQKPFFTNSVLDHPAAAGTPEGHVGIESFLTVPVLLAGELVGQIALSNSNRAYTDRDLDAVNRIAEFYALAIQHKRAEGEIRILNQELEQRVLERTAELAASNRELEGFTYSVSHDLRAPVRHIDGFLGLLEKNIRPTLNEQGRHYLEAISDSSRKMGQLIDDLLSFSRMGRRRISFREVDLDALAHEVIQDLEVENNGRDVEWRVRDMPLVKGDPSMLRIVLYNLMANALKFTLKKSRVRIEIGSMPGHNAEVVIFVRDNGAGFDPAFKDKLFRVFHRLHHEDEFEGTGIGLANVKRIIDRHGGRVWAEGALDRGATFYFSLPVST